MWVRFLWQPLVLLALLAEMSLIGCTRRGADFIPKPQLAEAYSSLKHAHALVTYNSTHGKPTNMEALRQLCCDEQARSHLLGVLRDGTSAGQLYALIGLKAIHATCLDSVLIEFSGRSDSVTYMSLPDFGDYLPVSEVAEHIRVTEFEIQCPSGDR
jgi:hypothetical protein